MLVKLQNLHSVYSFQNIYLGVLLQIPVEMSRSILEEVVTFLPTGMLYFGTLKTEEGLAIAFQINQWSKGPQIQVRLGHYKNF